MGLGKWLCDSASYLESINRISSVGCSTAVFYKYSGYLFINNTAYTFQINLWFTEKCFEAELRIDQKLGDSMQYQLTFPTDQDIIELLQSNVALSDFVNCVEQSP